MKVTGFSLTAAAVAAFGVMATPAGAYKLPGPVECHPKDLKCEIINNQRIDAINWHIKHGFPGNKP